MNKHNYNTLKGLIESNNFSLAFAILGGYSLSNIEKSYYLAKMVNELAKESDNNELMLHLFDNDLQSYLSSEGNIDYILHEGGVGGNFLGVKLHDLFMELLEA